MVRKSASGPDGDGGESGDVTSWEDLQREVEPIVDRINDNQSLALAAAANPIFALEELGYRIDPEARPEIEDRLRFRPPHAKRLGQLRRDLYRLVGGPFDPASDADVRRVLSAAGVQVGRPSAEPDDAEDPFERLRGRHPLIEPLLEYRRLEAAEPRFATRDVYIALREGRRSVPITRLRAILKNGPGEVAADA